MDYDYIIFYHYFHYYLLLYSDTTFDHVVEKFVKNQEYWHAAIGFGPALSRTYSFNFDECEANKIKGGLSYESFDFYKEEHPTGTMQVSCIFLSSYKYKKLKKTRVIPSFMLYDKIRYEWR